MLPLRAETLHDARSFAQYKDNVAELRQLADPERDPLLDPLHFLASTDGTRRSCSVACWSGDDLVGLLYATEHIMAGLKTGYATGGDYAGRGLLLCETRHEAAVIRTSLKHMTSHGIHSVHLRHLLRDSSKPAVPGMKVCCVDGVITGDRLPLRPDFEQFLATLGRHTRRNIRNYMRKVALAGITFVPALSQKQYQDGVERLNAAAAFQADPLRLARDERFLALHAASQRAGLRAADGSLVALLCGFTSGDTFHLLTQMNDQRLEHLSLSLALRGYAIEHLIATGHTDLFFVGGSSLSLGRFCVAQDYRSIFADKKSGPASIFKDLTSGIVRLFELLGAPVPEILIMLCNTYLDEGTLFRRTALAPAALVFPAQSASS